MIDDSGLSDEEWAMKWIRYQKARMAVIDECVRTGSLRPLVDDLVRKARTAYGMLRDRWQAARDDADFAGRAVQAGRGIGNGRLVELAVKASDSSNRLAELEWARLEAATKDVILPAVARAAKLADGLEAEPEYNAKHPRPGVPAWYYPDYQEIDR